MRNAIGIFGCFSGAVVVALVARYGFATSDTTLDGAIAAFFFGVIAVGGIGGPAVAVHLFRSAEGWARLWGVVTGAIAAVALVANLSNSLGAIASRADKTLAERAQVADARKDDRAELQRILSERAAMSSFVPTNAEAVAAAKRAADTASKNREAECDKRGPYCRQREADEKKAADTLADAAAAKAASDRAASLETKADEIRERLGRQTPVASINPLADTLARVFHVQADDAATWQQIATVVVVELLIAFSLIAFELLSASPATSGASAQSQRISAGSGSEAKPEVVSGAKAREVGQGVPQDGTSIARFMLTCLPRAEGERASWGEVYARYKRWCTEQSPPLAPVDLVPFGEHFREVCERVGVKTRTIRKRAYCLDVKLA